MVCLPTTSSVLRSSDALIPGKEKSLQLAPKNHSKFHRMHPRFTYATWPTRAARRCSFLCLGGVDVQGEWNLDVSCRILYGRERLSNNAISTAKNTDDVCEEPKNLLDWCALPGVNIGSQRGCQASLICTFCIGAFILKMHEAQTVK